MILMDAKGHLVSDQDEERLHLFARYKLGLRRSWYQDKRLPHYNLTTEAKRRQALLCGAKLVSSREIVLALRNLRRQ